MLIYWNLENSFIMHTQQTYPHFFARFYDTIYNHIRDNTDHSYFLKKILSANGSVLEVGTGTGRFFMDALNEGADIYGIDFSPAMVEILKSKLPVNKHDRVSVQDVRKMKLDKKFDLIVAPFRVFMHLITVDDQLKALNKIYEYLNKGGSFVFDLFVPDIKMLLIGLDQEIDFEGEYSPGCFIKRYTSMHADLINQISHVTFRIDWEEGGHHHSETWQTDLRFFFRYEIQHLIQLSKLNLVNIYGDFEEHVLTNTSKEFIVVCQR